MNRGSMDLQSNVSPMDLQRSAKGKPFLTKDQVISLVREMYHCEVKKIKLLEGYQNQNFLLEAVPLNKNLEKDDMTIKYILKVTNSHHSKAYQCSLRDATRVMEFLSTKGFSCSQPVPNENGDLCQLLTFQNVALDNSESGILANQQLEDTFMITLVTFLPGTALIELPLVANNVFEEMGKTLAQVHVALQELDIDKTALQKIGEESLWSLECLIAFRDFLYMEDLEKRQLAENVINEFERIVLPRKEELPHGLLHGDFNDGNIIIDDATEGSSEAHMIGFIDFEDVCYSCTVYDVGISLMYVLQCKTTSKDSAARKFLLGYNRYRPLTQMEKDCLFYCIAGRFVQSLLAGLYHYSISKDEYVLSTQQRGWDALKEIWTNGKKVTYQKWNFI